MPVITQITTHETDAQARLLSQFKDAPLMTGLLGAFTEQAQDYEDAVITLTALLDISTMVGVQLDGIGTIVGEARQGKSDADYRVSILARIAALHSSGTAEDIIAAFVLATGASVVQYMPDFPAGYDVGGNGTSPSDILTVMEAASVAGVEVGLISNLIWEDSNNAIWEDDNNAIVIPESSG